MLITNSKELLGYMDEGYSLILDKDGELHTQTWAGYSYDLARSAVVGSRFIQTSQDDLLLAMATLVEKDAISNYGPCNLKEPLPFCGRSFEDLKANARKIVGKAMVGHCINKELHDQPRPIQDGVKIYLQSLWKKIHPEGDSCYPEIKAFVEEQVKTLKESPGHVLSHLACNYHLTSEELSLHMKYIEESIQTAIQETCCEEHKSDFDDEGIYTVFNKDCVRETPFLGGWRFGHDSYDNETLISLYQDKIKEEFPDISMRKVICVMMSQTISPVITEVIRGMDTPYPLCPFIPPNSLEMPENFLMNVSNEKPSPDNPRRIVMQTPSNVLFKYSYDIQVTSTVTGESQKLGNLQLSVQLPKDQFPLPLGAKPKLQVTDINLQRKKGIEVRIS